jgi:putative ABC transport system ATP-binding protein
MTAAIVARDVCKSFCNGAQTTHILRGVSLEIAPRETVFLVGPSGSGKTTLLSVLGCILTPDRGEVEVLGRPVAKLSNVELTAFRSEHLGFVFQSFNLFPTLSALDNVQLALSMRGWTRSAAKDKAAHMLEQVGLKHRLHTRPARLSGGECQRVAIARGLAADPAIVFADEPTASLDADSGQSAMRLLSRLVHERGGSLVVVTHDNRIASFAHRVLHLEDGQLAQDQSEFSPAERKTSIKELVS